MSNVTQCTSHPCLMTRWHSLPAITRRSTAPPERPKSLGFQVARLEILSVLQIMDKTQCCKEVMICHYYQSLVHRPCKNLMIDMYGYLCFVGFSLLKLSYFTTPSPHPLETVSPELLWVWTWRTARSASNAGVLQGRHPTEVAPPEHEVFFDRL